MASKTSKRSINLTDKMAWNANWIFMINQPNKDQIIPTMMTKKTKLKRSHNKMRNMATRSFLRAVKYNPAAWSSTTKSKVHANTRTKHQSSTSLTSLTQWVTTVQVYQTSMKMRRAKAIRTYWSLMNQLTWIPRTKLKLDLIKRINKMMSISTTAPLVWPTNLSNQQRHSRWKRSHQSLMLKDHSFKHAKERDKEASWSINLLLRSIIWLNQTGLKIMTLSRSNRMRPWRKTTCWEKCPCISPASKSRIKTSSARGDRIRWFRCKTQGSHRTSETKSNIWELKKPSFSATKVKNYKKWLMLGVLFEFN